MSSERSASATPDGTWRGSLALFSDVARFQPRMLVALLSATILVGLSEALTFASLIPLLNSVGGSAADASVVTPGGLLGRFDGMTGRFVSL